MAENGKSGIIGLGNIFDLGTPTDSFQREDDILPMGKDGKPEKPEGEQVITVDAPDGSSKPTEGGLPGGTEPEPVPIVEPAEPKVDYRHIVNSLVKRGVLPNMKDAKFELEEGKEIGFDELDIDSEDRLCDIIETVVENQKKEMLDGKIDASSISDLAKQLIQADKAGADIAEILQTYSRQSGPIEKLDVENKADQLKIIRHYVSLLGLPKEDAEEYYNNIVNRGDDFIEARALKYKAELDKRMESLIQEKTRQAEEKRKADAEAFKKYKKDLKSSIQNKFQVNDNMVQKVLDFALKSDDNNPGVSRAIEKARQMLMNPEAAPDLLLFLMDQDEFIKQKSNAKVSNEKQKIFKMLTNTSKSRTTAPVDDRGREVAGIEFDEIRLQ